MRLFFVGMNADTCVSYCDMTSMDSYYSPSSGQGRVQQANPYRTFQPSDAKYSPTFLPAKGQPYGDKPRSPFHQECPSLDDSSPESAYSKYHLFMQRPTCKTPSEDSKLEDGGLISCYGEWHHVFVCSFIRSLYVQKMSTLCLGCQCILIANWSASHIQVETKRGPLVSSFISFDLFYN